MQSNSHQKSKSNALGYFLAGAVGLAAGFFVTKALKGENEESNKKQLIGQQQQGAYQSDQYRPIGSNYQPNNQNQTAPTTNPQLEACEDLICPITLEVMQVPLVSKKCGHSFEQKAINEWLDSRDYCPKCHVPLGKDDLIINYSLKNAIEYMKNQAQMMQRN